MKLSALRNVAALRTTAVALTAALSAALIVGGGAASAAPEKPSAVTSVVKDGRTWHLKVYSAAMKKDITVDVQRPADESTPAPNFYMFSGLDAGEGSASWQAQTDALGFLADKHVNVVLPIGGRGSYYTDWKQEDPRLGLNKWKTFFTEELPPLLDSTLNSTGLNALAGLSTSGTSVLQLAEAKPGLFKSVAAYSGCAQIADPMGKQAVKFSVETWAGGKVANMYGADDDPAWVENDPVINAEKLRGTLLYVSSGSGMPTNADVEYYLQGAPGPMGVINLGLGVGIEAATNACTHNLKNKLDSLNIPATYQFTPMGTHYWPYWEQALHDSWPLLAEGMATPA
ncbi:alpha/beta hydrolase family protein [Nocardia sp. AG03]|uniref:alpha/beta hydrolase n=1 Tax=Nocardia sp. AG03 TaxID=3025312 RepID=UPI0024187511|nr:alpha/beta hydrolase family protein [Nocardia sp. AG03]